MPAPSAAAQLRVMSAIERCRTAALGGHVEQCDECGHQRIAYNSCRNRHCPKCQSLARAQWLEERQAELLPVEYFHVVFTVPEPIAAIAFQNKEAALRPAVPGRRRDLAHDRRRSQAPGRRDRLHGRAAHLGPEPAAPPAPALRRARRRLSPDGQRWIACRPGFFLPVRVLSRLFRRLFLEQLQRRLRARATEASSTRWHRCRSRTPSRSYLAPCGKRRVGGLRQAAVRRPRAGAEVPGPLHPPGGHLQPPADRTAATAASTFRWKDYRHGSAAQDDALASRGVHPPLPAARAALGICAHPPLRLAGQPHRDAKLALPRTAGRTRRRHRPTVAEARTTAIGTCALTGMSLVDCPACKQRAHGLHRDLAAQSISARPAR